jgi:broad specificity phosphatase PhoE
MVWFVRHAAVERRLDVPAAEWELSAEGREAARALAARLAPVPRVLSSPEPKALDTARPLAAESGVELEVDERLREVARATNLPTYDEHRQAVRRYLAGDVVDGWEAAADARRRFAAAVEGVDAAAVVTHATVLALFLGYDAERWERIALPDVVEWQP